MTFKCRMRYGEKVKRISILVSYFTDPINWIREAKVRLINRGIKQSSIPELPRRNMKINGANLFNCFGQQRGTLLGNCVPSC